ncbi:MAG TPA: class II fructose-bisphosphatase [Candidatus Eisenbacteria bacterium]|nr:class II fructose-bisphosphatase [Candidatus Eisenbacteria bacterium]
MDRNLALEALWVTESAAISAAKWRGRGDKIAADDAATKAMREAFRTVPIRGTVRIGEGEMDEAPMLYIGEQVGSWNEADPLVDVAVDPLEGTKLTAANGPGAITVIAFAEDGKFLNAPDMYMNKIAVGPEAKGAIDINRQESWNLAAIAEAKRCNVSDLTAIILDRERHKPLIAAVRAAGACVQLISDGDLMAALATADPDTAVDVLFGWGGAPEGVLAAAALRCMGGDMQGVLIPEDDAQAQRAMQMTGKPLGHVYGLTDLAGGHVMFAATGVTDGPVMRGVRFLHDGTTLVESIVMRSKSGTYRKIRARRPPAP